MTSKPALPRNRKLLPTRNQERFRPLDDFADELLDWMVAYPSADPVRSD
jgi:hypothetical protein